MRRWVLLLATLVVASACSDDGRELAPAPAVQAAVTSGPTTCEAPVSHTEERITSGGVERTYRQDVPPNARTGAPLVIGLHGYGATGALFHLATNILETAHQHGFVLLAPDALPDESGEPSWDVDPGSLDVRFVEDLIDHAVAELCVDPTRVHLMGHSQGGFLISTLACTSADRISAVAPVAGLRAGPPGCAPADPVPLLAFHDTTDTVVPYSGGLPTDLAARLHLPADGPSVPDLVATWTARNPGVPVQLETTDRYGHGWPPDANELIWAFFSRAA